MMLAGWLLLLMTGPALDGLVARRKTPRPSLGFNLARVRMLLIALQARGWRVGSAVDGPARSRFHSALVRADMLRPMVGGIGRRAAVAGQRPRARCGRMTLLADIIGAAVGRFALS